MSKEQNAALECARVLRDAHNELQARAQLAAQAGVVLPEGCRLVPVEPSAAMLSAAFDTTGESEGMRTRVNVRMLKLYRAFLAAAPTTAPVSPNTIDLVFDGELPNAVFVEAEDGDGNSINAGHWFQREDGYWILRISSVERQPTQEEKDAAAHRYLARAKPAPASDVVPVPRELANRLLSRSDTTDYQLACAELRDLLNGGH
jgi:hypothetical protein